MIRCADDDGIPVDLHRAVMAELEPERAPPYEVTYEVEIRVKANRLPTAAIRITFEDVDVRTPLKGTGKTAGDPCVTIREACEHLLPEYHHITSVRRLPRRRAKPTIAAG